MADRSDDKRRNKGYGSRKDSKTRSVIQFLIIPS